MKRIVELVGDHLVTKIVAAARASREGTIRFSFSGPPRDLLESLFSFLTKEHGAMRIEVDGETLDIPVFLVDADASDPTDDAMAARCTPWHLVKVRTGQQFPKFLALHHVGEPINQSLAGTQQPLGIGRDVTEARQWLQTPLVKELVERSVQDLLGGKRDQAIDAAIEHVIEAAWEVEQRDLDRPLAWDVLVRLTEIRHPGLDPREVLSAILGLPCCGGKEFGSKAHLGILDRVASLFEARGLRSGFDFLEGNIDDEGLRGCLQEMRQHVSTKQCMDANEFSRDPMRIYSPIEIGSDDELPKWWRSLTLDAWLRILENEVPPESGKLTVTVQNVVAPAIKGVPQLAIDQVELQVLAEDAEEPIEITISRASGNARLEELGQLVLKPNEPGVYVDDDVPSHDRFVRYSISAPAYTDKPTVAKVIVLDHYGPGVVVYSRSATKGSPFKFNKKAKNQGDKTAPRYECELELSGMGSHQVDLYTSKTVTLGEVIRGEDTNAEQEPDVERPINRIDANHSLGLLETDEECHYDFQAQLAESTDPVDYRIFLRAAEATPTGASSEFDRLVIEHRASATGEHANARVEPLNCRALALEEWALADPESYRPIAFGPDHLDAWRKPDWAGQSLLSNYLMPIDPRPAPSDMTAPEEFLEARRALLSCLSDDQEDLVPYISTIRLHEHMGDMNFRVSLGRLLDAYAQWLESDYDTAAWADTISFHAKQKGVDSLDSVPYAILLSPFHPVRLAWQCKAQDVLQKALETHARCPAASTLNPAASLDCMPMPCRTASGSAATRPFVALASSSDYWGVMWSLDAVDKLGDGSCEGVFTDELGICIDGLSRGFTSPQVVRTLDELARMLSAKSMLKLTVSSDTTGTSSCNDGIDSWCSDNLGPETDCWREAGPRSLMVIDQRDESLQPEQAALASLTSRTEASVRWFTGQQDGGDQKSDLSIIAHLGTMSHASDTQGIRSVVDSSALTRWRIRKQLPGQNAAFIAESRIGEIPKNVDLDDVAGKLLSCVDSIERRCRDEFDSYVFAPNMAALRKGLEDSRYCAVSASNVDAACFFGMTESAYLWDFELPSYARRAGENSGYFLLATQSPAMRVAVRSALEQLGQGGDWDDEMISALLSEISRRGMPTLKRLTTGGSMSFGEVGMLIALRLLQAEFNQGGGGKGILPVVDGDDSLRTLNLVVPVDPFQNHFESLRFALEKKRGERPDLLVLSIQFESGTPTTLQVTPIEVKARNSVMTPADRKSALSQASQFSAYLALMQEKAEGSELWRIAWRGLLATLLDYGFRVYGQLDEFMEQEGWARQQMEILASLASDDLQVKIDGRGRLVIVDATSNPAPLDLDGDGFAESLVLSHAAASSFLRDKDAAAMVGVRGGLGDWALQPEMGDTPVPPINPPIEPPKTGPTPPPVAPLTPSGPTPESSPGVRFPVGTVKQTFDQHQVEFFPGNTALNQLNVGIVGDLGTGKTQLVQALVHQLRANPESNRGHSPNVLIFDYKKDYSNEAFVEATGARVISPFDMPLNLFDTTHCPQQRNAWLERSKFFFDVLNKIYPGLGPVQQNRIKRAVRKSYEEAAAVGRVAPTIYDIFDKYEQECGDKIDSAYSIMSDLVDGGYFVHDQSQVLPFGDLMNGVVVVNLAEVGQDDATKNMLVVIFLNLFYEHMLRIEKKPFLGEDPCTRFVDTMLLVDEADNIMQYEFDVLKKILLQGREFGVGVLLASQYLSHFKTSHENYLEPLLTWFIHKVPNIKLKELEGIGLTGVSADMADTVKNLACFECLLKTLNVDGEIIRTIPFFELMES